MEKLSSREKIKGIVEKAKQERSKEIVKIKKLESILSNNRALREKINEELIETGDVSVLEKLPKENDAEIEKAIELLNERYNKDLFTKEEKSEIKKLERQDVEETIQNNKLIENEIIKKFLEIDGLCKQIISNIEESKKTSKIYDPLNVYVLKDFDGSHIRVTPESIDRYKIYSKGTLEFLKIDSVFMNLIKE